MRHRNPSFAICAAVVESLEARREPITTLTVVDGLVYALDHSTTMSPYLARLAFARAVADGYFGARRDGHKVWESIEVYDAEGGVGSQWFRWEDLNANTLERNIRLNRRINTQHATTIGARVLNRDALLLRDPSGEQLRLGDLEGFGGR